MAKPSPERTIFRGDLLARQFEGIAELERLKGVMSSDTIRMLRHERGKSIRALAFMPTGVPLRVWDGIVDIVTNPTGTSRANR